MLSTLQEPCQGAGLVSLLHMRKGTERLSDLSQATQQRGDRAGIKAQV